MSTPIKNVVVVGAGTMGSGIAMVAAATGHYATLVDLSEELLGKARAGIEKNANRIARRMFKDDPDTASGFVAEALARISFSTCLEEVVPKTDLVIEAIVENIKAKQDLFRKIDDVAAATGHNVTLVEVNDKLVEKAVGGIRKSLERVAKKQFKDDAAKGQEYIEGTLQKLKGSTKLEDSVASSDLVIEAIVEKMNIKHELFSKIDAAAQDSTIFASNTSSLSIGEIGAVTKREDRFGGLHFFNPVPMMKLLEVIRTDKTSEETYQQLMEFGKRMGKTCITCKDTPGFVVNRLLVPYFAEVIRLLERGDASARDIDIAMKLGAGFPMGPIELIDYVGLDTTNNVLQGWHQKYPETELFNPPKVLEKLVSEGKLGIKSGEGFYSYKK